jgi:hypothetical protein
LGQREEILPCAQTFNLNHFIRIAGAEEGQRVLRGPSLDLCEESSSRKVTTRRPEDACSSAKLAYSPTVTYSFLVSFANDLLQPPMHRLTARLLLILMLSGTLAPAALAISAPSPHACCKRKPLHNHGGHSSEFRAPDSANHDCCRSLTVSERAQPRPSTGGCVSQPSATLLQPINPSYRIIDFSESRSARAPPTFSIA